MIEHLVTPIEVEPGREGAELSLGVVDELLVDDRVDIGWQQLRRPLPTGEGQVVELGPASKRRKFISDGVVRKLLK